MFDWQGKWKGYQHFEGVEDENNQHAYCKLLKNGERCNYQATIRKMMKKPDGSYYWKLDNTDAKDHLRDVHDKTYEPVEPKHVKVQCPFCAAKLAQYSLRFSNHFGYYCEEIRKFYSKGWSKVAIAEQSGQTPPSTSSNGPAPVVSPTIEPGRTSIYIFREHKNSTDEPPLKRILYIGKTDNVVRRIIHHRQNGPVSRHAERLRMENRVLEYAVLGRTFSTDCGSWVECAMQLLGHPGLDSPKGKAKNNTQLPVLLNEKWELTQLFKGLNADLKKLPYPKAVRVLHLTSIRLFLDEYDKLEWTRFDGIGEENRDTLPKHSRGKKRRATLHVENEQLVKKCKGLEEKAEKTQVSEEKAVKYQLRSRKNLAKNAKLIQQIRDLGYSPATSAGTKTTTSGRAHSPLLSQPCSQPGPSHNDNTFEPFSQPLFVHHQQESPEHVQFSPPADFHLPPSDFQLPSDFPIPI